ncbi:Protein phosphatase 1 regulatory subunit 3G [Larimichthys crocea]|uniref:Protein phosphatase 1 regulatory subunit 3G n=1 Tax=Larimichthys crocea TaxID=215358 RepID=A0A6G0HE24_LARCR|nr:Protein phosphatase 1 regulatory subunit 3G [Larimichthys crocea]
MFLTLKAAADCTRSVVTTLSSGGAGVSNLYKLPRTGTPADSGPACSYSNTGRLAARHQCPAHRSSHNGGEPQSMKNGAGGGGGDEEGDLDDGGRFPPGEVYEGQEESPVSARLPGGAPGRRSPGATRRGSGVKFADSMGLNLASVKHFSSLEEPQIPSKVVRHKSFPPQQQDFLNDLCQSFKSSYTRTGGVLLPGAPGGGGRVQQLHVCLERVTITKFDVRGQIRVLTGCSHKEVGGEVQL